VGQNYSGYKFFLLKNITASHIAINIGISNDISTLYAIILIVPERKCDLKF